MGDWPLPIYYLPTGGNLFPLFGEFRSPDWQLTFEEVVKEEVIPTFLESYDRGRGEAGQTGFRRASVTDGLAARESRARVR